MYKCIETHEYSTNKLNTEVHYLNTAFFLLESVIELLALKHIINLSNSNSGIFCIQY